MPDRKFCWPTGSAYKQIDHAPADSPVAGDWIRTNWIDAWYNLKGSMQWHTGEDLVIQGQNCKGKPVYSIADGTVRTSKDFTGQTWRNTINVDHVLPDGCHVTSRYAHLDSRLVNVGDIVAAGQQIGTVGDAFGVLAPHLHFDVCDTDILDRIPDHWPGANKAGVDANYIDPLHFLTEHNAQAVEPPVVQAVTMYVTEDGLRLRSGPGTTFKILALLAKDTAVVVDANNVQNKFIRLVSGAGWLAIQYLTLTAPQPPIPPTGVKGYGPHFLNGQYDAEIANKYPVVKVMDNPGALVSAHNDNPDRMFIHRRYNKDVDNAPKYVEDHGGAAQAALAWFNMYKADFEQCPWAFHEGPCEAGVSADLIAFEYERAKLMGDNGYKPLVLNLGVGQTNDALWKRADMQRLLAVVEKVGGAIGLHCYAEGVMSASSGAAYWNKDGTWSLPGTPLPKTIDPTQSWLALRIVRDRDVIASLGYHPQLIATELGVDDCAAGDANGIYWPDNDRNIRGWRTCWNLWNKMGWLVGIDAFSFYRCQLKWWVDMTELPGCVYAHQDRTGGDPGCFDTVGML